jgi:cytochrome c553
MAKMMRAGWAGLALLAATLSYAQTTAAPDDPFSTGKVEAGASKTAVCTACHGPNGNSANPEWPRLAGQSAVYVAEQLKLFKTQVRANPVMMPMASGLSDQDVNDVAVYYQAQALQGLEADPSYWQAGQALYIRGDRARNILRVTDLAAGATWRRDIRHFAPNNRSMLPSN